MSLESVLKKNNFDAKEFIELYIIVVLTLLVFYFIEYQKYNYKIT